MKLAGVVDVFDDQRGDGVVVSDAGERLYFHCVVISDGSRTIDVGTLVEGERRVGHCGRDEIAPITPSS